MDLSEATTDGGSGEATRVDCRCRGGDRRNRPRTNFTSTTDEAILMLDDTPATESTTEAYHVETTTVDESRKEAGGFARLAEGIN